MRDQFAFLGVATPERRAASRVVLRERRQAADWDFVAECWAAPEREFQYVACDHLKQVPLTRAELPRLKELVSTKSWWDTVDALAKPVGRVADAASMHSWADDADLWVRRAAILHQLGRGDATDTELLARINRVNLGGEEFFIAKSIGWALRDYSRSDPDWVRGFLTEHAAELPTLARREAAKHLSRKHL